MDYSQSLIKQATLDEAFNPAKLKDGTISKYGFGWRVKTDSLGNKMVAHWGDNPGYKIFLVRFLNTKETLIVLCNNAFKHFHNLIKELIHAFRE